MKNNAVRLRKFEITARAVSCLYDPYPRRRTARGRECPDRPATCVGARAGAAATAARSRVSAARPAPAARGPGVRAGGPLFDIAGYVFARRLYFVIYSPASRVITTPSVHERDARPMHARGWVSGLPLRSTPAPPTSEIQTGSAPCPTPRSRMRLVARLPMLC